MTITCPHCGKRHSVTEAFLQKASKVRCARCQEKFYLDELPPELITTEADSHKEAQKTQKEKSAPSSIRENSRYSRSPIWNRFSLAIGIAAVLVIAGTAAFYFLHVAPEHKFRQAMRDGERAENLQQWDEAVNAFYRAERLRPKDAAASEAQKRVLEKQRLAEHAEAMARGKSAEQSGNWELALRAYQTALARRADDADAKDGIRRAQYGLHMIEAREAEQQKRWEMALIAYFACARSKTGRRRRNNRHESRGIFRRNGARKTSRSRSKMGLRRNGL